MVQLFRHARKNLPMTFMAVKGDRPDFAWTIQKSTCLKVISVYMFAHLESLMLDLLATPFFVFTILMWLMSCWKMRLFDIRGDLDANHRVLSLFAFPKHRSSALKPIPKHLALTLNHCNVKITMINWNECPKKNPDFFGYLFFLCFREGMHFFFRKDGNKS